MQTVRVRDLGAGNGVADVELDVAYLADHPRGADGTCAFCHGDPLGERSGPEALISIFWANNRSWAESCPMCDGRPT